MTSTFLRVLGATATGVVAVGAVAAAVLLSGPWAEALAADDGLTADPVRAVEVQPGPVQLVCAPPARLPEGADVGDSQFTATPVETRTGLAAGVLGTGLRDVGWGVLGGPLGPVGAGPAAAVHTGDPGPSGTVLQAQPLAASPFRAAAATASVTTAGDLRGLAAAPCVEPSISQWIVGGGTEVGTTSVLTLQNPGSHPAVVALRAFGPTGPVALGSQGQLVLAAGESTEVRLEAVAPEQRRIAVHVTSTGARVAASLQVQRLDGLVPQGVDLLAPGAAPAPSVALAGLVSNGESLDDPNAPVLRLLAPGDDAGTARVTIYGADGIVRLRGAEAVDLQPGVVTDLPLGGLPAGSFGIVVDADVPVVAAAGFTRVGPVPADAIVRGNPVDLAWVAGQPLPEPGQAAQAALPPGPQSVITLTAVPETRDAGEPEGEATAVVRVYGADGAVLGEREVRLPSGRTARLGAADLAGGTAPALVSVETAEASRVVWGVELTAEDGSDQAARLVSALAPTRSVAAPGSVRVREVDAAGG